MGSIYRASVQPGLRRRAAINCVLWKELILANRSLPTFLKFFFHLWLLKGLDRIRSSEEKTGSGRDVDDAASMTYDSIE